MMRLVKVDSNSLWWMVELRALRNGGCIEAVRRHTREVISNVPVNI